MTFKDFVRRRLTEGFATGAKLPLYADIDDALGQYPPLYGMPKAPDLAYYIWKVYGDAGPTMLRKGIFDPNEPRKGHLKLPKYHLPPA